MKPGLIVIPARMESKRLPGKPLLRTPDGRSLLQHTYEAAKRVPNSTVVVATGDYEIAAHCVAGLMSHVVTREHENGTSRVAEAAESLGANTRPAPYDVVVNWQCDWPMVLPVFVGKLIESTSNASPLTTIVADAARRGCVNVIVGERDICHWFTRTPISYAKRHVGVYAFVPPMLRQIAISPVSALAKEESLEQLSWLCDQFRIRVGATLPMCPLSIDTQEDWDEFCKIKQLENG